MGKVSKQNAAGRARSSSRGRGRPPGSASKNKVAKPKVAKPKAAKSKPKPKRGEAGLKPEGNSAPFRFTTKTYGLLFSEKEKGAASGPVKKPSASPSPKKQATPKPKPVPVPAPAKKPRAKRSIAAKKVPVTETPPARRSRRMTTGGPSAAKVSPVPVIIEDAVDGKEGYGRWLRNNCSIV